MFAKPISRTRQGKMEQLKQIANYFGITEDQAMQKLGLNRDTGNGEYIGDKTPGVVVPPTRALQEGTQYGNSAGVAEYGPSIPAEILRRIPERNPVVAAGINLRCMQIKQFGYPAENRDEPGWQIQPIATGHKPTSHERDQIQALQKWFFSTGANDFPGWEDREDNIPNIMGKVARDQLEIDKVAIEIRRNRLGKILDYWAIDAGTIRRVYYGGYGGKHADFNPRIIVGGTNEFREKIAKLRIENLPDDLNKIAFVQMVDGSLTAAFTRRDMVFDVRQQRTDIRYWGEGCSPLEQAMWAVTGFLNGMAYNSQAFNKGTLPKIALAFKDRNYSPEQMADLQDQWLANFTGYQGAWRMPMLNGEVSAIPLMANSRDMEYQFFMQMVGALILAVMGIDSAELGLRFQGAQNVLNDNPDAKQKFSKARGLIDMLYSQAGIFNRILQLIGFADRYVFRFTGIDPEDAEARANLRDKKIKSYMTIDEIRAEENLPPLPGKRGDLILENTYYQNMMNLQQSQQEQEQGGDGSDEETGDDDFDSMLSEAVGEVATEGAPKIQKAERKPTMLI